MAFFEGISLAYPGIPPPIAAPKGPLIDELRAVQVAGEVSGMLMSSLCQRYTEVLAFKIQSEMCSSL